MDRIKLFTFYRTPEGIEKYQYPIRIVDDRVHYLNYSKPAPPPGIKGVREHWAFNPYGQINQEDNIWWPEEDIISGSKIEEKAQRMLIAFILKSEGFYGYK